MDTLGVPLPPCCAWCTVDYQKLQSVERLQRDNVLVYRVVHDDDVHEKRWGDCSFHGRCNGWCCLVAANWRCVVVCWFHGPSAGPCRGLDAVAARVPTHMRRTNVSKIDNLTNSEVSRVPVCAFPCVRSCACELAPRNRNSCSALLRASKHLLDCGTRWNYKKFIIKSTLFCIASSTQLCLTRTVCTPSCRQQSMH